MANEKFTITIHPDGTVEAEGDGFKGNVCEKELEKILAKLGKAVGKRKKSEFYQKVAKQRRLQTGQ